VGATKSCKIKVKFRFRIDKDQTVETGIFDIAIWNPVNEEYHRKYPDGQEMVERFVELGEKAARSKLDYSHGENYELQKLRDNLRLGPVDKPPTGPRAPHAAT
jgi:hypothetical protein